MTIIAKYYLSCNIRKLTLNAIGNLAYCTTDREEFYWLLKSIPIILCVSYTKSGRKASSVQYLWTSVLTNRLLWPITIV